MSRKSLPGELANVRSQLMAMPGRLAPALVGVMDPAAIEGGDSRRNYRRAHRAGACLMRFLEFRRQYGQPRISDRAYARAAEEFLAWCGCVEPAPASRR